MKWKKTLFYKWKGVEDSMVGIDRGQKKGDFREGKGKSGVEY